MTGEQFEHRTANREDGARLDIVAQSFWGRDRQRAFFDVRVFDPYAHNYQNFSLSQCYRKNELEKKRECVREIKHGSFSPPVFSAAGGMGTTATIVYKRLASFGRKARQGIQQNATLAEMQVSLLRSAITGSRSIFSHMPASQSAEPLTWPSMKARCPHCEQFCFS